MADGVSGSAGAAECPDSGINMPTTSTDSGSSASNDNHDQDSSAYPKVEKDTNGNNNSTVAWDLSWLDLDSETLATNLIEHSGSDESNQTEIHTIHLHHNRLDFLPRNISNFANLQYLDISNNRLVEIPSSILDLRNLRTLLARNNSLENYSLPKEFGCLPLEVLNLSGNGFKCIPQPIFNLRLLRALYMGGNEIEELSSDIAKLERLEMLYLGGNRLQEIPAEVGQLQYLKSLVLSENRLHSLPSTISSLHRLRSLSLHKNMLTTLPPEIVSLRGLIELSLRDNPLVVRFVRDMMYEPPSLQELSSRCIKICKIPYTDLDLPASLVKYLSSAQRCVNPKCKGVYFDTRVENIKFVDFCGKYRLPLLQFLCSPKCSTQPAVVCGSDSDSNEDDYEVPASKLRRVLLG